MSIDWKPILTTRQRNFRIKIIAVVYILAVAVLALLMYQTYSESLGLIKQQFAKQQMFVAKQTAHGIEKNIKSLIRGLETISQVLGNEKMDLEDYRKVMAKTYDYVKSFFVNDFAYLDRDGFVRLSLMAPHLEGVNYSFKNFFKSVKAQKTREVFFEFTTMTGGDEGQKGLIIAMPVYTQDRLFNGVVYFTVRIDELINSFVPFELQGTRSCVLSATGEVLCNPRELTRGIAQQGPDNDESLNRFFAQVKFGEVYSSDYIALNDGKTIGVRYPIRVTKQTWSMIIATPVEVLSGQLTPFIKKYALIALCVILVVVVSSFFLLNLMTKWNIELDAKIKNRTAELYHSQQQHKTIIETINELIWETDAEGVYTYVSPVSKKILGYDPEEILGTSLYDLMTESGAEKFKKALDEIARQKQVFTGLQRNSLHKNGSVIVLETNGAPIIDENATLRGFRGADRDITIRTKAEEELQKYADQLEEARNTLEQKVEERTNALKKAHESLLIKEKFAAIGELASSVSHELRNPLGVIKNAVYFFNMKMDSFDDETVRENIKIITREIDHANKIIADILDFTRDKSPVRLDVNLNNLVTDVLSRRTVPDHIRLIKNFYESLPMVSIDPTQVAQIFDNLIENAIQAMDGGGTLRVTTRVRNANCEVAFTDTGCGIPARDIEKIFAPLFTSKAKGIGLGLAISKNMAEANGGNISAESIEGRGSTFTVSLKVKE